MQEDRKWWIDSKAFARYAGVPKKRLTLLSRGNNTLLCLKLRSYHVQVIELLLQGYFQGILKSLRQIPI